MIDGLCALSERRTGDTQFCCDVGAGDAVTALFEVIPAGFNVPGPSVDSRKYSAVGAPASGFGGELLL
jgi:hypothetical protein